VFQVVSIHCFRYKNNSIVDYAHTPDALENENNNDIRTKNEQLLTVVGCGGNRDKTKRPIMAIATDLSDKVVLHQIIKK
jgi:UDP-N-acetylmuramoyl-L-alanyl-D-glutamate--2,6-diaminopimelate ligase